MLDSPDDAAGPTAVGALRDELVRLRSGRSLRDLATLGRLGNGFWGEVRRPSNDSTAAVEARRVITQQIEALSPTLRRHAKVEFNLDEEIDDDELGARQERLASQTGYSVKTIRRRGNEAVHELALRLLSNTSDVGQAPSLDRDSSSAKASSSESGNADWAESLRSTLFDEFWSIGAHQRVDIVCSELPPSDLPYYANRRDPNYLRYAKFADLDTLVYIRIKLAELFPSCYVRDFSSTEYFDSHADHLIIVGGPDWNSKAGEFQEYLPVKFLWDETAEQTYVSVDSEDKYPIWSPTGTLIEEYAMFARFRLRQGLQVSLVSGCLTYGVLAAAQSFLDPAVAEQNIQFVRERIGTDSFAIVARVREFAGIVQTPDLAGDCIAAYKSDAGISDFVRIV